MTLDNEALNDVHCSLDLVNKLFVLLVVFLMVITFLLDIRLKHMFF